MVNTHTVRRAVFAACSLLTGMSLIATPLAASAQVWGGNSMGVEDAEDINTGGNADLRETATTLLFDVISYIGLIAVVVIVIAGIYLIVGGGSEESRSRIIKVVIYTAVGMIVIVLASAIVTFIINFGD
jgi:type IV secretory pathway VirB2 component (pilin)